MSTNGSVNVWSGSRLGCQPPKITGSSGLRLLTAVRNLDRAANHRPGQHRNPDAKRVLRLSQNVLLDSPGRWPHRSLPLQSSGLSERCSQSTTGKRSAERRPVIGGIKQNDLAAHQQASCSTEGSSAWHRPRASAPPLSFFKLSLTQSSTGNARHRDRVATARAERCISERDRVNRPRRSAAIGTRSKAMRR